MWSFVMIKFKMADLSPFLFTQHKWTYGKLLFQNMFFLGSCLKLQVELSPPDNQMVGALLLHNDY